jgi:hypothetical protein
LTPQPIWRIASWSRLSRSTATNASTFERG